MIRPAACTLFLLATALMACLPHAVSARTIRVGIVTDGPAQRELLSVEMLRRAAADVVASDLEIVVKEDERFVGDWTLAGVDSALGRALGDANVDVVVTLGVLAGHEAAGRRAPSKPVLAPIVVDPVLQGFPLHDGTSGRHNFAYATDLERFTTDLERFHEAVAFHYLAILVDEELISALPQLTRMADELAVTLGARISVVGTCCHAAEALAALPPDADAVSVTGLLRFSKEEMHTLASGLGERRLPSFSMLGRSEVENGLLMTTGGAELAAERLARRVALMIERIAHGEDPATFDVIFPVERRLVINMQVAREIGFSPAWDVLADAELMNAEAAEPQPPLTLVEAMRAALDANPSLAANLARLDSSAEDVRIARAELLPSLDASAGGTRIDADRASPLTQAEETTSAGLELTQVIYSERAHAGYDIARALYEAAKEGQRQAVLDTLYSAASAYLDLLRAESVESVRRSNVEHTRTNLETSRVREAVGLAERSDYLRWVAQLATDKQSLLAAESTRRQAETELMRVMHRPADHRFATVETGLDDPLTMISSPRAQSFIDTPAKWTVFSEYAVHTALDHAPELGQADAIIASNRRSVTAARRAYFVPDLALVSSGARTLSEGGAGAGSVPGGPDDDSWSVSLQATLPLFSGRRRTAELAQARDDLRAAEADRLATADSVEARTRSALHRTATSWPAIALAGQAAAAARENLRMVTDAYARGIVTVTDLIDAQDTALDADLAAADAKYGFLVDFVTVLRAMSEFDVLLDPGLREAWLDRVDQWFRDHEAASARQES